MRLRVKQVFERSGLSQRGFGDRLGLKQGVVQRWFVDVSSDASVPDTASVALVCREFGVSGHWVLTGRLPMEVPGEEPKVETAYLAGWWDANEAHKRAHLAVGPSPSGLPGGISERLRGVYEAIEAGEAVAPSQRPGRAGRAGRDKRT